MDGRAGVQPTETNGSVTRDEPLGTSTSATTEEIVRFPLTIREVVRRGRRDREELERLRSEVDQLRIRAESAEQKLEAAPEAAKLRPDAADVAAPPHNGHDTVNGNGATNGNGNAINGNAHGNGNNPAARLRARPAAPTGWAPAAMLPSSRRR
jgi:hypothetical protein